MSRQNRRNASETSSNRSWFAKLLRRELDVSERAYTFEPLERRELMAADLADWVPQMADDPAGESAFYAASAAAAEESSQSMSVTSLTAEGEPGPDLVAFATALRDAGVTMFGAAWCPVCSEQKRLFQDGSDFLDFVEVTNADRTRNARGVAENITQYPTWQFQDGSRQEGLLTLEQLSTFSGIAIPTSSSPSLKVIANQTVAVNSPLHVPIDAYDPNGNPLTITVTSSNPGAITAEVVSGGRSARIATNFGDMVVRLFESESSRPTARFIELAQSGFFNSTSGSNQIFHRVVDNFVIQGGDPLGNGTGGSPLGNFDDQFNVNLQHNRSGVLSYAKSSDDTNDSQFFITEVATPFLNSNHSVFGQLVEGETVREAISETSVNGSDKPTNDVVIQSVTIFDDIENGLLRLRAVGATGSSSTITVTVTDSEGNQTSRTFTATAAAKDSNDPPFLNDFDDEVETFTGQSVTVQLSSQDAEGNPVKYYVTGPSSGGVQYQASVNPTTGLATITPPTNYVGSFDVNVGVGTSTSTSANDNQKIRVTVKSDVTTAPTSVDLATTSDSGTSDSDNVTNASSMTFNIAGTLPGATVELLVNGEVVGTATASGTTTSIATGAIAAAGAGSYTLAARQTSESRTSVASSAITVVYDPAAPAALAASSFPSNVTVGQAANFGLQHPDEGTGLRYAFTVAPAGAAINAETGVVSWTPLQSQLGSQSFTLTLTDAAGNVTTQSFTVGVIEAPLVGVTMRLVNEAGATITELAIGQVFRLQLIADDRRVGDNDGVFSTYLDVLYDSGLVEPFGATPITYGSGFNLSRSGNTSTAGVIDEIGASRSSTDIAGPEPLLFAEVRMRAKAAGQASFSGQAADVPGNDVALYGRSDAVPTDRIAFGSLSAAIGRAFDVTNDSYNVAEDSSNNALNVLANDTIRSGQSTTLSIIAVSTPNAGGSVVISGNQLIYSPAANYTGAESFTYTVRDTNGSEAVATVVIGVDDVNDPPIAVADAITVTENSTNNVVSVLSNDSDGVDVGETLSVSAVGTPSAGGSVQIGPSGLSVLYTPKAGFTGTETFTYTLRDNRGGTATASVTVNVNPAVPPPTAVADAFTVVEDAAAAEFDVLANDQPPTSGGTLSLGSVTASAGGTVSIVGSGSAGRLRYQPKANFAGTETVQYVLVASNGGRAFGTATFTVTAVNDPPVAVDDTATVLSQPNQNVDVLANDFTVDAGEVLTIASVTQPAAGQGTVSISADGKRLIYSAPNTEFEGTVNVSYTVGDGTGLTDVGNVTLTVRNFVPRKIGGQLMTAGGNSSALSGMTLQLEGTSFTGEPIARTVTVDASGSFEAADLPPGQYTVRVAPLAFRGESTGSLQINSAIDAGDSVSNVLQVGALLPKFIDVRDFLGRSTGRGLGIAARVGQTQQWISASGAWRGYESITATLSSDEKQLTLQARIAGGQTQTATLPLQNDPRLEVRASEGNVRYLKVLVEPSELNFTTPTSAAVAANSVEAMGSFGLTAEGESASPSASDAALQSFGDEAVDFSDLERLLKRQR